MIHDGEPITHVYDGDSIVIVRSFVAGGSSGYSTTIGTLGAGYGFLPVSRSHSALLDPDDEGTHWIRGHHHDNSEEVGALLAAYRLTRSAA